MSETKLDYNKKELPDKLVRLGYALLIIGTVLGIVGYYTDSTRAAYTYLLMFMFVLSVGVGSLFFVALEYLAGADWSTPIRRVPEYLASTIPFLAILVIPLLFSIHDLFHWSHAEAVAEDKLLAGKAPYLNTTFFIIRVFACIAIWGIFYLFMIRNSQKQDATGNQNLTTKNIRLAAIFMPVFAITISIAAIDWMMSLEPHWFSTIFGVYFFSGTVLASLAAITFVVVMLKEKGYFSKRITNDHLYSLGALMFVFINFWAYIAFSQYMLIWYADLPEETFWFMQRWEGSWAVFSILLIIIHFVIPYAGLLSQPAKKDPKRLKIMSLWILFAHFYDLYWLIMPNMEASKQGYVFSWIDFTFPVAMIGLIIIIFNMRNKKSNLMPVGDPKLERGLNFRL